MRISLLVVFLVLVGACGKHNDAAVLHHEAVSLAKYYQSKLDALDRRVQQIAKRAAPLPPPVAQQWNAASEALARLRTLVGRGPDQKSAVERQADAAVKDNKVADLEQLVDTAEATIASTITVIHDQLSAVESWLARDQWMSAAGTLPNAKLTAPEPAPPAQ